MLSSMIIVYSAITEIQVYTGTYDTPGYEIKRRLEWRTGHGTLTNLLILTPGSPFFKFLLRVAQANAFLHRKAAQIT